MPPCLIEKDTVNKHTEHTTINIANLFNFVLHMIPYTKKDIIAAIKLEIDTDKMRPAVIRNANIYKQYFFKFPMAL